MTITEKEILETSWLDENHNPSEHKVTELHVAAQNNDLFAVTSAIKNGVDINALTEDGWTALHFAAFKGYDAVAKILVEAGIDMNIQGTFYHRTALHYAADRDHYEVVRYLVSKGANTKLLDKSEKTAFDIATQKGFTKIAELLKSTH